MHESESRAFDISMNSKDIPRKANRVLYFVMLALLLIFVRIWYLQTSMREVHIKRARAPRQRVLIEKPTRGAIYDRFGTALAINQIQYNAAVSYAQIRDIPRVKWVTDETGKRQKVFARKDYIITLSHLLATELNLNAQDVEDLIHSRAALFPNTPYVIAPDISEEVHAHLKMQERLFPGLIAQVATKRYYPNGKVGADAIGYLGAIAENQYISIARELEELEDFLQARSEGIPVCLPKGYSSAGELKERYNHLKSQAYTINDSVGKTGCEKTYDQLLRGVLGKHPVEVDVRGQITRHLPGAKPAISGNTLTLSLSQELQAYAEELLAISEISRDKNFALAGSENHLVPEPWIKGGSIVAMVPTTGEVVALATYPNLDPNDFISKNSNVARWLESQRYIASIWDGFNVLKKDLGKKEVTVNLTWSEFLNRILSKNGQTRKLLGKINTLKHVFDLQETAQLLLHFSRQESTADLINALYASATPSRNCPDEKQLNLIRSHLQEHIQVETLKKRLNTYLLPAHHNDDKLLILDLTRLICDKTLFTEELIHTCSQESLDQYRAYNQASTRILKAIESQTQSAFHRLYFSTWREDHFASYLKTKRAEEKKDKRKSKPYLDYLQEREQELFCSFWKNHRYILLHAAITQDLSGIDQSLLPYFATLDLAQQTVDVELLKTRLKSLPTDLALSYLKTMRTFSDLDEALWGKYRLVKSEDGKQLLKHLALAFYPPSSFGYSKSHAYRQSAPPGSVFKIATAYAGLKTHYQHLPKGHKSASMINPLTLFDETSKGSILGRFLDGTPIPRLYKGGRLPRSFGPIGKVDLLTAMERSSNVYFAMLAGDKLSSPSDLVEVAKELGYGAKTGIDLPYEYAGILPSDLRDNRTGLYSFAIGQHAFDGTPLQTAVMLSSIANGGNVLQPRVLKMTEGSVLSEENPFNALHYTFKKNLDTVGIHFPLFTKALQGSANDATSQSKIKCYRKLFLPADMRAFLLEGLHRVVNGAFGSARPGRIKALHQNPQWKRDYLSVKNTLVGKTSTAEFRYHPTLDRESSPITCKHASFGGISFKSESNWDEPELAIVVSLRFGDYGKEAAPLAALIVKKWRELCVKYASQNMQLSETNPL